MTQRCVDSLRRGGPAGLRVVIVDNASRPAERDSLASAYATAEDVEIHCLPENRHFAGGVNAGAARALELGATHLFILNNDTEMEPDCVKRLVAAADAQPDAGIVGPALLDLRDRHPLSLGERYAPWSLAVPRTLLKVRSSGSRRPYRVGGIMGSALLVTRECFERVGPYREDLLVYYEDVDFCLRARALGYRPLVEPRAIVLHDGLRGFALGMTPYAARLQAPELADVTDARRSPFLDRVRARVPGGSSERARCSTPSAATGKSCAPDPSRELREALVDVVRRDSEARRCSRCHDVDGSAGGAYRRPWHCASCGLTVSRYRPGCAKPVRARQRVRMLGWLMGLEPTTTGITIRDSTN